MYLFIGADSQELDKSINHQLAKSQLWQQLTTQNNTITNNTIISNNGGLDSGNTARRQTPSPTNSQHLWHEQVWSNVGPSCSPKCPSM